jgi:hypothetical protein
VLGYGGEQLERFSRGGVAVTRDAAGRQLDVVTGVGGAVFPPQAEPVDGPEGDMVFLTVFGAASVHQLVDELLDVDQPAGPRPSAASRRPGMPAEAASR